MQYIITYVQLIFWTLIHPISLALCVFNRKYIYKVHLHGLHMNSICHIIGKLTIQISVLVLNGCQLKCIYIYTKGLFRGEGVNYKTLSDIYLNSDDSVMKTSKYIIITALF